MRYLLLVVVFIGLQGGKWRGCPTACSSFCANCQQPDDPDTWCTDFDRDGYTDVSDLLYVVSNWGPCPFAGWGICPSDVNADGITDVADLLLVLRGMRCRPN